jgi:chemotaxis protein MotB
MPVAEARVRPAATGGEAKLSGRKHTAVAFLAVVVVLASGWFWNSRRNQAVGNAGEGARVKTYLHLETFVLNLEDPEERSYLRIGIDLGLKKEPGSAENAPSVAAVRDTILGVLALAKPDELITAQGKAKLKENLLHALQERLPDSGIAEVYASAQVDQRKVGKLSLAIQVAFQELGVFPASTTKIPLDSNEPMPFSDVQVIQNAKYETDFGRIVPSAQGTLTAASNEADLSKLQSELRRALHHEIALHQVALHRESDGLVVSLREFGFFESGSAGMKASSIPALGRIASILAIRSSRLRIEGHTDNVPIHNPHMASNWELSTARSTELVRVLIVRYHFAPERLAAAGYAQYHAIASNDTAEGRATNRRVDIVILGAQDTKTNSLPHDSPNAKPSPFVP